MDIGEGDARGVIDAHMNIFPAHAARVRLAGPVAGDAMACALETPEFLDVEMYEFAGMGAFIAAYRRGRFEIPEAGEAGPFENPADRCRRNARFARNMLAGPTPAAA